MLYAGEIENLEQAAYKQDIQFYAVEVSLILRRQNKKVELRILPTLIAEKAFGKLIAPHLSTPLKQGNPHFFKFQLLGALTIFKGKTDFGIVGEENCFRDVCLFNVLKILITCNVK